MARSGRQDNSGQRRRGRMKPLADWEAQIREIEASVRRDLGIASDEGIPADNLVMEIVRLSDAWAVPGVDVVIPGTRDDLVRRWVSARLEGRGNTREDWIALAREVAPSPDAHLAPYTNQRGETFYRSDNKQLDKITAASAEYFGSSRRSD
jgi:hypothetical protein